MKHYDFDPASFIGWNRIARPGSILGPQQQYLVDLGRSNSTMNHTEEYVAIHGDHGQADRLIEAKKSN
jgi:hypothetical protein